LCETTSAFGTHEDGMTIAADGTWHKLQVVGGVLTPEQGFDEQGTWAIVDTSAENGPANPYQVNFTIAAGGTILTFPVFATDPRKMRLDNEGVFVADYVSAECP
jgi:hypothetical protein